MLGAIFDMDGLLIDSETIWQEEWHAMAAERGVTLPEDFAARICGTGGASAAIEGWPEIGPFRRICRERDILEKNGKSLARLGAPIGWNVKKIRESGAIPGEKTKTCQVPRVSGEPSKAKE